MLNLEPISAGHRLAYFARLRLFYRDRLLAHRLKVVHNAVGATSPRRGYRRLGSPFTQLVQRGSHEKQWIHPGGGRPNLQRVGLQNLAHLLD